MPHHYTKEEQKQFMEAAVKLSEQGMNSNSGGPFGAVVVKDGKMIGQGYNCVTSTNDPTAHAEVMAIREACKTLNTFELDGCEIFTSCEPCPMCLSAIYWARIDKIYFANTRADAAAIGFDDDLIYSEIPKSPAARKVPAVEFGREIASRAFEAWKKKPDKIEY